MLYTAPRGLMVTVGQGILDEPQPQSRYWLTVTVTAAGGSPGVSVPEAGDTLTAPSGSPATVTDQFTSPPDADSVIWPLASGSTTSVPPAGNADSVPVGVGVGCGDGDGDGRCEGRGAGACEWARERECGVLFLTGALVWTGGGTAGTAGGALAAVGRAAFDLAGASLRGATAAVCGCWVALVAVGTNDSAGAKAAGVLGSAVAVKC